MHMPDGKASLENDESEITQIYLHESEGIFIIDQTGSKNCKGLVKKEVGDVNISCKFQGVTGHSQ